MARPIRCPHCGGELSAGEGAPSKFDEFWRAYPRKVAKPAALKAFNKISPSDALFAEMLAALEWQRLQDQWLKDGGAFIPHPSTWLNGERWRDERPTALAIVKPKQSFREESRNKSQALLFGGIDPETKAIESHKWQ